MSMTMDSVYARLKTVTRRAPDTWANLRAGDSLTLIEKGMGLKKGERQVVICTVDVVDVRLETLRLVTAAEVIAEGLWARAVREGAAYADYYDPEYLPVQWFRGFWAAGHHGKTIDYWLTGPGAPSLLGLECRRIEWRYR